MRGRNFSTCCKRRSVLLPATRARSEEHTSELQSQSNLVCRLLLEKKNTSASQLCTVMELCHRHACCQRSRRPSQSVLPAPRSRPASCTPVTATISIVHRLKCRHAQ